MSPRIHRQQGATLVISLIMLVMVTMLVVGTMSLSLTNLRVAGNIQYRTEALAAANQAIEESFALTTFPTTSVSQIDINGDSVPDYTVNIVRTCLSATQHTVTPPPGSGSSVTLGFTPPSSEYTVLWDYAATVTDDTFGAAALVHQGVHQRLTQSQCDALCPPAVSTPCS